jgi:hypothetical protein
VVKALKVEKSDVQAGELLHTEIMFADLYNEIKNKINLQTTED